MTQRVHYYSARVAYAESEDGVHWVRPNLGLVEYHGSRDNNLVLIDNPRAHGLDVLVLHEPEDPDPSRRFKMMVHMGARFEGRPAGAPVPFFSADGLRWTSATDATLENYTVSNDDAVLPTEHFEMGGLYRWNGMYHLIGQQVDPFMWLPGGEPSGRVLTTFRSSDFVNWSRTKTLSFVRDGTTGTHAPKGVGRGEEVHQCSVWHRGNVLLSTYGLWHGGPEWKDVTIDLGLLISNDGLRYREPIDDYVFLRRGDDGTWDQGGLLMAQAFENVGDKTFVYYGHWDPRIGNKYKPRGGFGLATLDRDRFGAVSVKNPEKVAAFITCSIDLDDSTEIFVNASGLAKDASLKVELLDPLERPIPAFSGANSGHVREAGFRQQVVWSEGQTPGSVDGQVKIRFTFEGENHQAIQLYALYLAAVESE